MAIQKNFVVKHGLEVRDQLIFANALNSRVGINTSIPKFTLDVNGGIGATSLFLSDGLSLSGVLTTANLDLSGYLSVGGTTGIEGQYLKSTGSGVEWATFPTTRTKATYTAEENQSIFLFEYEIGFIDVFVNGVKLKGDGVTIFDEFIANDGTVVQLIVPREEGDIVEFIGYSLTSSINSTSIGGTIFGESAFNGSIILNGELSVSGVSTLSTVQVSSGIITASSGIVTYYGDTSNAADGRWTLGASGTSDYIFTGIGFTQTTNDPILYLARGRVYEFVNNSGGSHPFEIRVTNGGAAYNDGVTNNTAATGVIRFEVPFNAPNTLYYQCTVHSGMGNIIIIYPSI
jgi:hypothetical protein